MWHQEKLISHELHPVQPKMLGLTRDKGIYAEFTSRVGAFRAFPFTLQEKQQKGQSRLEGKQIPGFKLCHGIFCSPGDRARLRLAPGLAAGTGARLQEQNSAAPGVL